MRDNYLETDEFPCASFAGRVMGLEEESPGRFAAETRGTLTVHGVEHSRDPECTPEKIRESLWVLRAFQVTPSDHGIPIPKLMFMKINEVMEVDLDFLLSPARGGEGGWEMARNLGVCHLFIPALGTVSGFGTAAGQEQPRHWERRSEATHPPLTAFHSTQLINLPTAETLAGGEWQFEISHRFLPFLSKGKDAFWGLEGPINMRLGLGYAPSDRVLVTLARSSLMDNWDLQVKLKALELEAGSVPVLAALQGGAAWSSDVPERESGDHGNFQYYGQLIHNTLLAERLALGVVPAYLYNVLLNPVDPMQELYWGFYGQVFLTDIVSVNAEWTLGENPEELAHCVGSFGIELGTGGHFFRGFLPDSVRINPTQYLVGTDFPFELDECRLGFAVTRLLGF
jgi:hypothetical protein